MTESINPEPVEPDVPPIPPIGREEKLWAMFCHLAGFPIVMIVIPLVGQIVGPLVIWLIKKGDSTFVDHHGKEALNFQITITIFLAVSVVLSLMLVGLLLIPAVLIYDIIMIINATNAASNGQSYRYPYTFRFIK